MYYKTYTCIYLYMWDDKHAMVNRTIVTCFSSMAQQPDLTKSSAGGATVHTTLHEEAVGLTTNQIHCLHIAVKHCKTYMSVMCRQVSRRVEMQHYVYNNLCNLSMHCYLCVYTPTYHMYASRYACTYAILYVRMMHPYRCARMLVYMHAYSPRYVPMHAWMFVSMSVP